MTHNYILIMTAIVLVMTCYLIIKKDEMFSQYPFGPINPNNVVPWQAQSVYGMPGDLFQLCNNDTNQQNCAWKTLQLVNAQQILGDNIPGQYIANSTPSHSVGAAYLLSLPESGEGNLWQNL